MREGGKILANLPRPFLLEMQILHFEYCRRLRMSVCCLCVVVIKSRFFTVHPRTFIFHTGDLGDIPQGYFFFWKISQNWPPQVNFWPFLTYFFKSGAVFFWLVEIISFFGFGSSWGPARVPFLNFSKICVFAPVTDFRRFSFFLNRRNLTFFVKNLHKVLCRFFFGWPLVLDMAEGHVPRCRKGVSFWFFWKSWLVKKRHGV